MTETKTSTRISASGDTLQLSNIAANAVVDMFEAAMNSNRKENQAEIDALEAAMQNGSVRIRSTMDFDRDGLLHIQFFAVQEGRLPRVIVDLIQKTS